jgi:hypothetical protein
MDDLQQNPDHEIIFRLRKFQVQIFIKFLASFSTALLISWFLGSIINNRHFVLTVIAASGGMSLIFFLRNRPGLFHESYFSGLILLSQLIVSVLAFLAITLDQSGLFIASSIAGLLLLFTMDLTLKCNKAEKNTLLKEGQAFLSGLLIISFLSMLVVPFIFLASIKAGWELSLLLKYRSGRNISGIRILRFMLLIFAGFCLVTKISYPDNVITFIFICGEFIEMNLYNYDSDIKNSFEENSVEFQLLKDETKAS